MSNKDEYTPEQIFKLYQKTELDQSTAANYLAFLKKWKTRKLNKLKTQDSPNHQEIEELVESIEIIQDYLDIVLDYWIKEDDPTLKERVQLYLNNADISRLFKSLRRSQLIDCSAVDFSKHFANIKGERLKTTFTNSQKGANYASNKLVAVIEKHIQENYPD